MEDISPTNIIPGNFIPFGADNNDINEETLDGKDTTHATTLVAYQRKLYGPMPKPQHTVGATLLQHTQTK